MQIFSFIVSFRVTQHKVQTAALQKHKPRVKIYQSEEDNYETTEVLSHNHALNFSCKLKRSVNQAAVKPAVIFKAIPGYCLTVVHRLEIYCVGNCGVVERALCELLHGDCLAYGRLL
jgi:hypothetical protein